jgi:hypothetical protein
MATRGAELTHAFRAELIEWARERARQDFDEADQRIKYESALRPIMEAATLLRNLIAELRLLAIREASGDEREEIQALYEQGATLTDVSARFEDALWRRGVKLKSAHEWDDALLSLSEALRAAIPGGPAGFGQVDTSGRPIGLRYRMDGSKIDTRGRRKLRPVFEQLVHHLMDFTGGKLTFDKNGPSGTLVEVLVELQPQAPQVIPKELPASTIAGWVKAWRRRRPGRRTRKERLVVVK